MKFEYYTPKEISTKLSVSYRTVLREINSGKLSATRFGNSYLVSKENLEIYLNNNSTSVRKLTVAVAIVERGNEVLVVKKNHPENTLIWQFPAGTQKTYEQLTDSVSRECFEETNINCKPYKLIGSRVGPETKVLLYYFACEYIDGEIENKDIKENADVMWISKYKIKDLFTSSISTEVIKHLQI